MASQTKSGGRTASLDAARPLAKKLLRSPRSVLRTAPRAIRNARRVERAAYDVVPNTRKILDTATAHEHDRVLLEIMAHAGNVGVDLAAVGEPYTCHLAKRRVRLLRRLREDPQTNAPPLGSILEVRRLGTRLLRRSPAPNELLDRGHLFSAGQTYRHIPTEPHLRHRRDRRNMCLGDPSPTAGSGPQESGRSPENRRILARFRPLSTRRRGARERPESGLESDPRGPTGPQGIFRDAPSGPPPTAPTP